ncbi:GreA/GreB family elongation factor [Reichenbachiella versicolor]|uniref:GreA/GreB family elongation factor n=1 Tax=Reichenbachiella versicolor TaxID=1821036 RepID=UPI000D6EA718|nr:GreA/GreB family elongation factor [Reichenbachiella versicolor]
MINKKDLLEECLSIIDSKIDVTQKAIDQAQQSANNETKSSAGDKYETGRAMSQNERDMNAKHLSELLGMKKTLIGIDSETKSDSIELGAIVFANSMTYFISTSLGKVIIGNTTVFAISAISPIAQAMLGKKEGESFDWQGKSFEIQKVA